MTRSPPRHEATLGTISAPTVLSIPQPVTAAIGFEQGLFNRKHHRKDRSFVIPVCQNFTTEMHSYRPSADPYRALWLLQVPPASVAADANPKVDDGVVPMARRVSYNGTAAPWTSPFTAVPAPAPLPLAGAVFAVSIIRA